VLGSIKVEAIVFLGAANVNQLAVLPAQLGVLLPDVVKEVHALPPLAAVGRGSTTRRVAEEKRWMGFLHAGRTVLWWLVRPLLYCTHIPVALSIIFGVILTFGKIGIVEL
jgi:hypothetical protein